MKHIEENAAAGDVAFSDEQLAALDAAVPVGAVAGERYPAESMGSVEL
ncbi:MAG: hypothetical protein QOG42_461 [Solirubrobacteraceae bacterium]|nr:hypothetical protein [Solirubrobacteraceae bacterium]